MKIAFRLDDITEDMDWGKFLRFTALLDRYGIKPLLGVIPENKDPMLQDFRRQYEETADGKSEAPADFWAYIRELQSRGYVIAMHGHDHIYTTKKGGLFPLNRFSEFAGLPLAEQEKKLQAGYKILKEHGIETDIFMAPAHSYDRNTLRALYELSFRRITDGFGKSPYRYRGMEFYPISFRQAASLKKKQGLTSFVVHTNTLAERDFERYEKLLRTASENGEAPYQFISYQEYLDAEKVARGPLGTFSEYLAAAAKASMGRLRERIK